MKQSQEILAEVEKLEVTNKRAKLSASQYDPVKEEGEMRSRIALHFTVGFFSLLFLILTGVPLYNALLSSDANFAELKIDLTNLLQAFSAIVGPLLGFVVGFYFKERAK